MRILIADDHPLYLDSVRMQITRAFRGAEVVPATSLPLLMQSLVLETADLVMVDFSMPAEDGNGRSGVEGIRRVIAAAAATPVLVMSGVAIGKDVMACLAMGAKGFLPKTLDGKLLTSIVSMVVQKESFPVGAQQGGAQQGGGAKVPTLTVLERTILSLFLSKIDIADIALQVSRQEASVVLYLARAFRKMGVNDPADFSSATRRLSLP